MEKQKRISAEQMNFIHMIKAAAGPAKALEMVDAVAAMGPAKALELVRAQLSEERATCGAV